MKKPSEQTVKNTIAAAGGAIAGGMASKGLFGFIHDPAKHSENAALMKKGAIVLASLAGAMFVPGKGTMIELAKGALIGMAMAQGTEAIAMLAAKSGVQPEAAATSVGQKFLARAVGLGCAYHTQGLGNPGMVYAPRWEEVRQDFAPASPFGGNILEQWTNNAAA